MAAAHSRCESSPLPGVRAQALIGWIATAAGVAATLLMSDALEPAQRLTLALYAGCLLAWSLTKLDEWITGAVAVLALYLGGGTSDSAVAGVATHELVWLLIAAYLMAFAIAKARLLDVLAGAALRRPARFTVLAYRLTGLIAATAFLVPATSARAAMLLPLYRAMADAGRTERTRRALSLLFPSVILLSAGGVLTGAGAHIVALDVVAASGHGAIGYWSWLMLALPVALSCSLAACWLILRLFLSAGERRRMIDPGRSRQQRLAPVQLGMLAIVSGTVVVWMTNELHRAGLATAGLAAAALLLALARTVAPFRLSEVLRAVDWKVLALLVSTVLLAEALVASGAAGRLATAAAGVFPAGPAWSPWLVVSLVAATAMLSHLALPSRSARAAILIPAIALPLAQAGFDVAAIALLVALGTGFCQLSPYGAKPLMIFARDGEAAFSRRDLVRLGVPLMIATWAMLCLSALLLWPLCGLPVVAGRN